MLIHLPIIILTSLHPTPIADTAPKFDIARECQFGSKEEQKSARTKRRKHATNFKRKWIQFSPAIKPFATGKPA